MSDDLAWGARTLQMQLERGQNDDRQDRNTASQ